MNMCAGAHTCGRERPLPVSPSIALPSCFFRLIYVYEYLANMSVHGLLLCSAHGAEERESDNLGLGL